MGDETLAEKFAHIGKVAMARLLEILDFPCAPDKPVRTRLNPAAVTYSGEGGPGRRDLGLGPLARGSTCARAEAEQSAEGRLDKARTDSIDGVSRRLWRICPYPPGRKGSTLPFHSSWLGIAIRLRE